MSYAFLPKALGAVDEWTDPALHSYLPTDVFVLRLGFTGLPLRDARDVLPLVRAAGRGQNFHFDVRGAALSQDPGAPPDAWHADIVYTTATALFPLAPLIPGFFDDGPAMAAKVGADPGLRGSFPSVKVVSQLFGQLTGPADAVDHWRSQPILWDHTLGPPGGGPTDTFAHPVDFSIVRGKADDGARAIPWKIGQSPLVAPPGDGGSSTLLAVGLVVAAGLIGLHYVKGQEKRR